MGDLDYQMNTRIRKIICKLSANHKIQKIFEELILDFQYFEGIGAGTDLLSSGEIIIFEKLIDITKNHTDPINIFDVGANKGLFIQLIIEYMHGNDCIIHAFEPSKYPMKTLSEKYSSSKNINLNNFGLGKTEGEFKLHYDKPGSGLASLSKRKLDHFGINFEQSEMVKIKTLDQYCYENKVRFIDLLKLDVEGYELVILEGGIKMFEEKRVRMVSFEFGGANIDSRTFFQDFYYFFKNVNMTNIFRITPSGYLYPIQTYKEIYEQFRTTNFLVTSGIE